jgi:hypothetical protein
MLLGYLPEIELLLIIVAIMLGALLLRLHRDTRHTPRPFLPDAVLNGVPYRTERTGQVIAMVPGGLVRFASMEQFSAAAHGSSIEANADQGAFPNTLGAFRYRPNRDGSVDAIRGTGETQHFQDWASFWREAGD